MYVDTSVRPQGEQVDAVAPAKLKLSAAIRIGAKISRPTAEIGVKAWVTRRGEGCFSCVIGAAWLGLHGLDFDKYSNDLSIVRAVLTQTGASESFYEEAQYRYERLGHSRESIADWLEAQGL